MGNKPDTDFIVDWEDPRLIQGIEEWNLIEFLEANRVNYSLSGKNIGRDFIGVIPCPFCGDSRNHFGIHKDKKFGNCFSCGRKSHPLKIVSYFGRMNYQRAFDYLVHFAKGSTADIQTRVREILKAKRKETEQRPIETDPLPTSRIITKKDIDLIPVLQSFFNKRYLSMWHVNRYDLRISLDPRFKNHIIFPCRIKNKVMSYQTRSLIYKRYHNADHLDQFLFNEDRIIDGNPLILVEGFLDMARMDYAIDQWAPERIQVVSGGLKTISAMQKNRLTKYKPNPLVVIFDNDSWFNYSRIKNSMPFNVDFVILPKGTDPSSLTENQMENLFRKEIIRYV